MYGQRPLPVADIIKDLKAYSESSGEAERIDPKSNKAKEGHNSLIKIRDLCMRPEDQ